MRALLFIIAIGVWVAPLSATAEEFRLGWAGTIEWDDNIFNTAKDSERPEENDFVFRTGPLAELRRTQGDFTYDVRYRLRWESYIDESGLDAFDHTAFGRASWRIGPRTELFATNRFLVTRSLNRSAFVADPAEPDVGPDTDLEVDRQRIKRNVATAGVTHNFSSRLQGTAQVQYSLFRSNNDNRFDSDVVTGTGSMLYTLSSRDQVGGGAAVTLQSFDDTDTQAGNDTYFYRVFASWVHTFDPTMTFSAQFGPTFIDGDGDDSPDDLTIPAFPFQDTRSGGVRLVSTTSCPQFSDGQPYLTGECDTFPQQLTGEDADFIRGARTTVSNTTGSGGGSDTSVTLFANIEFQKRWEKWRLILTYSRTDSTASGAGTATVLDSAQLRVIWEPLRRWEVQTSFLYQHRESATDQDQNVSTLAPVIIPLPSGAFALGSAATGLRLNSTDNFLEADTFQSIIRISRRFGERSIVFTRLLYYYQRRDDDTVDVRKFDNFRVTFGFRVMFDPILL